MQRAAKARGAKLGRKPKLFNAKVLDERPPHDEQVTIDRASVAIARLKALLVRIQGDLLCFSESFPDGNIVLAKCARLGLEGIVCKRPAVQSTGF